MGIERNTTRTRSRGKCKARVESLGGSARKGEDFLFYKCFFFSLFLVRFCEKCGKT